VNHKKIQRSWRQKCLGVPYRRRKQPLRGVGAKVGAMCPIAPNVLWAGNFQFDQTDDARPLKLLHIVDEYTREELAMDVERSIDADHVVATLDRVAAVRGYPSYLHFDHGPESSRTRWRSAA
jgi:putative transposase